MPSKAALAFVLFLVFTVLSAFVIQSYWSPGKRQVVPASAAPTIRKDDEPALGPSSGTFVSPSASPQNGAYDTVDLAKLPKKAQIDVPIVSQLPELFNGCEITSLTMIMLYAGLKTDKMEMTTLLDTDPAKLVWDGAGNIVSWGNPHKGFVGDITGKAKGFGVYHEPIAAVIDKIAPGQSLDLTGKPFEVVLDQVAAGKPVLLWTNGSFGPLPSSSWVSWKTKEGPVKVTWREHAVVLTGYDETSLYVNDPLDGTKNKKIDRKLFIQSWEQMGKQSVTYR
ncbi:C39 family peptidase [Gorillibacterium sp. CAU 1737]|uniref:C39 family peptidase n=1 Tax=Gorillibacterium sp. CAU 1737 TaxID=3140362 RepID=UPI003261B01A